MPKYSTFEPFKFDLELIMVNRSNGIVRYTFLIILFSVIASAVYSQEEKKVYRPDIPGQFMIDYGVNGTIGSPDNFEKGWWGSRSLNLYYYYPLRVGKSKFMVNAGIGLGIDRFKFTNRYYLADTNNDGASELVPNDLNLDGVAGIDSITFLGLRKSFVNMNYLDIPLEVRWNLNPDDLNRTFWVSVGGRAGWMFSSNTKIKQKIDSDRIMHKDKYDLGLNKFRYGASLRIGVGNFNWYGFYNLSPLFQKDKGPSATQMNTWTIGISLIGL